MRRILLASFVLPVAVLGVLGWAGYQAAQGAYQLQAGADLLQRAQAGLVSGGVGDDGQSDRALRAAGSRLASARAHLGDPVVGALAHLPGLRGPLRSARGLSSSADVAVNAALLPLIDAAGSDPATRLIKPGGAIDVDYLASLARPTSSARRALLSARADLLRTPAKSGVGRLDTAREQLATRLAKLQGVVDDAALASRLAPRMLGRSGVQRYLLISQSPAEARGTGGLVGGYSLLEANRGKLRLVRGQARRFLKSPGTPVVELGKEYDAHYAAAGPSLGWINSNISPHYPYAAQIWKALWERQFPEKLDGVLVLDPVALSYLLTATGPVPLPDGTVVNAGNVASLTMRNVYARFSSDPVRDAFLQQISSGIAGALIDRKVSPRPLVSALSKAVGERRLLLWSSDPATEQALSGSTLAGEVPRGKRVVGDDIVDIAGSKLDFYLERRLTYTAGCRVPSTLSLRLRNGAPTSGLPDYVTPAQFRDGGAPGTNRLLATMHLPAGSTVQSVSLDGVAFGGLRMGTELDTVWVEYPMDIAPQRTRELVVRFAEPADHAGAPVRRLSQPLVRPEVFTATAC